MSRKCQAVSGYFAGLLDDVFGRLLERYKGVFLAGLGLATMVVWRAALAGSAPASGWAAGVLRNPALARYSG